MTTTMKRGFFSRADFDLLANASIGERALGGVEQLITTVTVAPNYVLGAKKQFGQSIYRYGLAGAVNLALGVLCQAPVPAATEHDLVPVAASYPIGTRVITLTTGAAVAVNEYAGGWLMVNDGVGQGQCLRILSHPANAGAALCAFTCLDPLTTAMDATSLCALTANPYNLAVIHPSPPTSRLNGVPVAAINAGLYGWFQTRGPASIVTDGVLYVRQQVRPSTGVNGAVSHAIQELIMDAGAAGATANGALLEDSAGAETAARLMTSAVDTDYDIGSVATIVGRVMRVEATGDYSLIFLTLE